MSIRINEDFEVKKIYYSILEVSKITKVAESTIRFWIDEFDISVRRNSRKVIDRHGIYHVQVKELLAINYLLKIELFTIRGAVIKLKMWKKGEYQIPESYTTLPTAEQLVVLLDKKKYNSNNNDSSNSNPSTN